MNSYLSLLRANKNYRYLWLGALVSQFGDWFNLIASTALVNALAGSSAAISYLFLSRFLPLFFFSPLSGVLADRFNRRYLMIGSDVLRALTVLGFLVVQETGIIWLFYLLTISQFALSAIFTPARTAVIANIVGEDELVTANALDSFTWSTMLAIGSLVGGLVAARFGTAAAFMIDAGTFLVAAFLISRIVIPERIVEERAAASRSGWLDFVDGLRYLRGRPYILAISVVKGAGSLVWGAINVLEVNYAEDIFPWRPGGAAALANEGSLTLGLLYALTGLGTGLGPLLLRRVLGDAPRRQQAAIVAGFWILGAGILGLSLAPTLPWLGLATLVRTVGSGVVWVFSAALLQRIVPDRFRGRVFAFEFALLTLTQSISIFWAGYAQDSLGWSVRATTAGMGALGLVVALLWSLFHVWTLRRSSIPAEVAPAVLTEPQSPPLAR